MLQKLPHAPVPCTLLELQITSMLGLVLHCVDVSHRKHKLAHVPCYPQPLRPLRHHPHVQAHVPVPSRLPRVVALVEAVLHPQHLHSLVCRQGMQAARQVLQVLKHDALPHDVHQPRHVAVVGARELLDGAIDALEAGPLDPLEHVRVVLGVDPSDEVHVVVRGEEWEAAVGLLGKVLHDVQEERTQRVGLRVELIQRVDQRRDLHALVDVPGKHSTVNLKEKGLPFALQGFKASLDDDLKLVLSVIKLTEAVQSLRPAVLQGDCDLTNVDVVLPFGTSHLS